ncbi:hypothetical protein V6N11_002128 [Hibiscus sabdariffa]|uniref:Uncharacterized protein n=1 Tax=Hibiscus sabdariffa TaxID=183260 RepID=A0ABR2QV39_9ROSI
MSQFPSPYLFGVRSSMEINHTRIRYHIYAQWPGGIQWMAMVSIQNGNNGVQVKNLELRSDVLSPVYLCKLDISAELDGSNLYDQCMSLMNVERNKDLSKDVTMLVNLKNGGRPVQNTSIVVLSPSLIPTTNASVFQNCQILVFGCMSTEVPKPVLNGNKAEESKNDQMNSGDVVEHS